MNNPNYGFLNPFHIPHSLPIFQNFVVQRALLLSLPPILSVVSDLTFFFFFFCLLCVSLVDSPKGDKHMCPIHHLYLEDL